MKLNVTKDRFNNETHTGPVFEGAEEREYAYQGETVYCSMKLNIHGWPPRRGDGKENRELPDQPYSEYDLVFERHTGKAIVVKLIGHRKDVVEQRRRNGFAVTQDILWTSVQMGELINMIFSRGAQVHHETEAFPDTVKAAMRVAYPS